MAFALRALRLRAIRPTLPQFRSQLSRRMSSRSSMQVFDRRASSQLRARAPPTSSAADVKLRQRNRAAAAGDFDEYDYLRQEIAERLCDRLLVR